MKNYPELRFNRSFFLKSKITGLPLKAFTAIMIMISLGNNYAQAQDPFLGEIKMVGFNFAPQGWATCDGQVLQISQNQALFSLLGTTFGADGENTFKLPDLRGRSAIHVGTGPGLSPVSLGQIGGAETVTLTVNNLPSHNHTGTIKASTARLNAGGPTNNSFGVRARGYVSGATPNVDMQAGIADIGSTGGNQSFSIRQPFLGIYHIIALQGIFPSQDD